MSKKQKSYFPSKIYNTDSRSGDEPAYSILSMTPNFGLEDAIEKVRNNPPNNIFILINGQQTLANDLTDDDGDACFGRALCGIDRIEEDGKWKGKFKIHTSSSGPEYVSIASTLFDAFGEKDLIIDVVNAKYDWDDSLSSNKRTFERFCYILQHILEPIIDPLSIRFFIAGFSRGGMFSIKLANWVKENGYGSETIVATIDPVIKPGERKDWVVNWADWKSRPQKKNRKWEIGDGHAGSSKYKFPILKAPGDKHYNVFERDGLGIPQLAMGMLGGSAAAVPLVAPIPFVSVFGPLLPAVPFLLAQYFIGNLGNQIDYPIGASIEGATAPGYELTGKRSEHHDEKYKKLPLKSPYDQFDIQTNDHTFMPDKYLDWMRGIIFKHFPAPQLKFNKNQASPGEKIIVSFTPVPQDLSEISLKVDHIEVSLNWLEKAKAEFIVPIGIEPGYQLIHTLFYGITTVTNLLVTPFIRSLAKKHVIAGDTNTLYGHFNKGDLILLKGKKILPKYFPDRLIFTIPNDTQPELIRLSVLSENKYESNSVEMFVCARLNLTATCSPDRVAYIKPAQIKIASAELIVGDLVLLNGQKISQKFYDKDDLKIIEFTARFAFGFNKINILRQTDKGYFLSHDFLILSCDLTGNIRTKELHHHNCIWVSKMKASNKKLICSSYDLAYNDSYDNCHWCLGGSTR